MIDNSGKPGQVDVEGEILTTEVVSRVAKKVGTGGEIKYNYVDGNGVKQTSRLIVEEGGGVHIKKESESLGGY